MNDVAVAARGVALRGGRIVVRQQEKREACELDALHAWRILLLSVKSGSRVHRMTQSEGTAASAAALCVTYLVSMVLRAISALPLAPDRASPRSCRRRRPGRRMRDNTYQIAANLTYLTASNYESKMDIYYRRGATTPLPTVVYFHGGFWAAGNKEGAVMKLLPWMEMGWNVVNVEYRLARVAPAPAAVEDCLCALRYLAAQAKTYMIDVTEDRHDRRIGRRAPVADERDDSRERGSRSAVRGRGGGAEARGRDQLVRHHRCVRRDRRPQSRQRRDDLARQPAEPRGDRQARLAADLRARGSAADPHDSRRRRSRRPVSARACGCTTR